MFYRVSWKSHDDPDAGHVNVEANDEQEARNIAWARLEKHYEDELRDLGIEIVSIAPRDQPTQPPDANRSA